MTSTSSKNKHFHFRVHKDQIPWETNVFPFDLYVYNPKLDNFTLFLHANVALDETRINILDFIYARGGCIGIDVKEKTIFFEITQLAPNSIADLNVREKHHLELIQEENIERVKSSRINSEGEEITHNIRSMLGEALEDDDFDDFIRWAKDDISCFPAILGHQVNLTVYLANLFMTSDTNTSRLAALCYHLAFHLGIRDEIKLSHLVCAALFSHIGETQIQRSLIGWKDAPLSNLSEKLKGHYKRHPAYAQHIIRKSKIDLEAECLNIILEHHERYDGNGYPEEKIGKTINPLSLILGFSSHLLEYPTGLINGETGTLRLTLQKIKGKHKSTGLEFEFGDKILDVIESILEFKNSQKNIVE